MSDRILVYCGEWVIPIPQFKEGEKMNNKYNQERYNRMKQKYRVILGIQQFLNYPLLNFIWGVFAVGTIFLAMVMKKFISNMEIYSRFETIFWGCMKTILIVFPVICAIALIQFIGFCFAIRDESDLEIVFCIQKQSPILISKKKDKRSGVIKREFYTTIPMEQWQEKKETICDRMDIHLIGDISYGGRKKNKGNHIYFESAKGRKPKERGVLYDDIF